MQFKNIIVTNDDGIDAPGLAIAERLARTLADNVWVFAPATDQSGKAQALTMHEPLRVNEHGPRRFSVTGTPADCVMMALGTRFMAGHEPDLVISGTNWGHNLSDAVMYSGTVGAALTAAHFGLPAIALSQAFADGQPADFATANAWAQPVFEQLQQLSSRQGFVWNVNFPDCSPEQVQGLRVTRQINGSVITPQIVVDDTEEQDQHWLAFERHVNSPVHEDSDVAALQQQYIAAMPMQRERCNEALLNSLGVGGEWALDMAPLATE